MTSTAARPACTLMLEGVTRLVEVGPKKVLLGLAKTVLRDAELIALDAVADLEALAQPVAEQPR